MLGVVHRDDVCEVPPSLPQHCLANSPCRFVAVTPAESFFVLFPAPRRTLIGNYYYVLLLHCVSLIVSNCDLKMKSMKRLHLGGDINLEELVKQGEISLDSAIKPNFSLLHLDTVPPVCS